MADTDTNQETDTTQEDLETSAGNIGRGLSEQEAEAERIRIQEEWKKYVENSLKNDATFNGMDDKQKAAELSRFFGVDENGNVLLKSPHEGGGILKYSTVKNNDGTYNERISFPIDTNKKQGLEFNQVAADDMARTAITMGWKQIKVSNCETSSKEMIWLAVQKENLLRGSNLQITNFKPSENSPILKQLEEFKASHPTTNDKKFKVAEEGQGFPKAPFIKNQHPKREEQKSRFMPVKEGEGFTKVPFTKNKKTEAKEKLEALEKKVASHKVETIDMCGEKNLCLSSKDPIKLRDDLKKLGIKGEPVAMVSPNERGSVLMNSVILSGSDIGKFQSLQQKHAHTTKLDPSKISVADPGKGFPKAPLVKNQHHHKKQKSKFMPVKEGEGFPKAPFVKKKPKGPGM